jgi:hypothetical protein
MKISMFTKYLSLMVLLSFGSGEVMAQTEVNAVNTPGDAASVFKIVNPGSYFLSQNVAGVAGKNGIVIATDRVILDLSGFSLLGVAGSLNGVLVQGQNHVVKNGVAFAWGHDGFNGSGCAASTFEKLFARANANDGISMNTASEVVDCISLSNGRMGFATSNDVVLNRCVSATNVAHGFYLGTSSIIKCSFAYNNGASGYVPSGANGLHVVECVAAFNAGAGIIGSKVSMILYCAAKENKLVGIIGDERSTIKRCVASLNGSYGIAVLNNCHVIDCTSARNIGDGILVSNCCRIVSNLCNQNAGAVGAAPGAGIRFLRLNRVEGNTTIENGQGIVAAGGSNVIIRNNSGINTAGGVAPAPDFVIAAGNLDGAVVSSAAALNAANNANVNFRQ